MTTRPSRAHPDFLLGDGREMDALTLRKDWSGTLGPVEAWPQSLRTAVGISLNCPFPIAIFWGPDRPRDLSEAIGARPMVEWSLGGTNQPFTCAP